MLSITHAINQAHQMLCASNSHDTLAPLINNPFSVERLGSNPAEKNEEPFPFTRENATTFLGAAKVSHPNVQEFEEFRDWGFICAALVVAEGWPESEVRRIFDEICNLAISANTYKNDELWSQYLEQTREKVKSGGTENLTTYLTTFKIAREKGWLPENDSAPEWLHEMNSDYFVAPYASTVVVFHRSLDNWVPLKTEAFKLLLANKSVEINTQTGTKKQQVADVWLRHPERKQYRGVGFWPEKSTPDGMFNLWLGWPIPPVAGDVKPALNHILEVICNSDHGLFEWVIGWCAYCIQHPYKQGETALAVIGGRGTGKTMFADWMKAIFGRHSMSVANVKLLTGDFTGHLEKCILLVAEEAFWAGNRDAEGALKHVITGNTLTIHHKGFTPYDAPNHLHVIMTSNEDWVIPAGVDERRFCVCKVSNAYQRNASYFTNLAKWAEKGGVVALLDYLLCYDLTGFDARTPPDTAGLREQKLQSLDPATRWVLHRLEVGGMDDITWKSEVSAPRMVDNYCTHQNLTPHERRRAETQLGTTLSKIFVGVRNSRKRLPSSGREKVYQLPHDTLENARAAFENYSGLQGYDWGESL
jgi:hypothetical protein